MNATKNPNLSYQTKPKKRWPLVLLAVLMLSMLAACGDATPAGKLDTFLINEVFTNTAPGSLQWVELLNNGPAGQDKTLPLKGITLASNKGSLDLGDVATARPSIPNGGYLVIVSDINSYKAAFPSSTATPLDGSKVLGNLNANGDALVLKDSSGIIDQVGWGNNSSVRSTLGVVNDLNMNLTPPNFNNKSLGRTPPAGPRDPNSPGVFTIHDTLSPSGIVPRPSQQYEGNFLISRLTDILTFVGAAILWVVFVMVALIARRFQELARQKTYWEYLLIAPVGILIYDIGQVLGFIRQGQITADERWWSFGALFISGIACLIVVNFFRSIAKNILEAE